MAAYYNEIDPFAAAWLRELIGAGYIAPGEVDTRSIEDVTAGDLRGFTQCHFFAGIGVWSYALRCAGWPDDRQVWTGSCPCQPFSSAGKRGGTSDERHLWPAWFHIIDICRPPTVFGEQVASKDGLAWLDLVQSDMEGAGYAVGALDLCAAGFGAPHIRQRLYFVGELEHPVGSRISGRGKRGFGSMRQEIQEHEDRPRPSIEPCDGSEDADLLAESSCTFHDRGRMPGAGWRPELADGGLPLNGFWRNAVWLPCRDGKARPVEPCVEPMADGIAGDLGLVRLESYPDHPHKERIIYAPLIQKGKARVGRLRGYGNAIVCPVATEFIRAYMESKC